VAKRECIANKKRKEEKKKPVEESRVDVSDVALLESDFRCKVRSEEGFAAYCMVTCFGYFKQPSAGSVKHNHYHHVAIMQLATW
jgi:hypothetical protein